MYGMVSVLCHDYQVQLKLVGQSYLKQSYPI